jgi:hypothetical protein
MASAREANRQRISKLMISATDVEAETDTWNTPPDLLARVYATLGDPVDLDPCSNATSIVHAKRKWTREDDGYERSWKGHRTAFVNPPYGDDKAGHIGLGKWLLKCSAEHRLHGVNLLALIPARTGRGAVQAVCYPPQAGVCFLKGRLVFGLKGKFGHPAQFSSLVVAMATGPIMRRFAEVFADAGKVWIPNK